MKFFIAFTVGALAAFSRVAAASPTPNVYASLDQFLGEKGAVPTSLAGYTLGQAAGDAGHQIEIRGWGTGMARAVVEGGKVRHVVVELYPDTGGVSEYEDGFTTMNAEIRRRFGAGGTKAGAKAQLFAAEYSGFLRETSSLVLNLLPAGESHVCGKRDGFAEFFKRFRTAAKRHDPVALSRMVVNDPNDDMITGDIGDFVTSMGSAPPGCALSREQYWWESPRADGYHGGSYVGFRRDARGVWTAFGPRGIDHDTTLELSQP